MICAAGVSTCRPQNILPITAYAVRMPRRLTLLLLAEVELRSHICDLIVRLVEPLAALITALTLKSGELTSTLR